MTIAPNVLHFAYISRFVLGFAALTLVILRKTASRFLRFTKEIPWRRLLLLVNSAQNLTCFHTADFWRDCSDLRFSRIWHGNKVGIKNSIGRLGAVGKMPACVCRAVCIIKASLLHAVEVSNQMVHQENISSGRGLFFNPGARAKQCQRARHGGKLER
jgi:hypothetical protein